MRIFYLLFFLVSYAGHLSADDSQAAQICQQHHCVIVVDAGSTGSRIHIYSYDVNQSNQPIDIQNVWSKRIQPGLASLDAHQEIMNTYLNSLFDDAPKQNLPVYFYATAGMRLLSEPKQTRYYTMIRSWFDNNPQWQLMESKTITGQEEALFGWLTINYGLNLLVDETKPMVGVMDMGGASVQIAFPVSNIEGIDEQNLIHIDINGRPITLFIHSFLGLGQTTLSYQFLDAQTCFPQNYPLPSGRRGQGDANACQQDVSQLINQIHHVKEIVQPALQTNPVNGWYTLGGLNHILEDDALFNFSGHQFTNITLLNQANNKICQQTWTKIYHDFLNHDYIYGYCLFPSYYYALMVNGYGIAPEENIHFLSDSKNLDWTLGVVLHHR